MPDTEASTIDTSRQPLGKLYAKALLGASENAGSTDTVLQELTSLIDDVCNKLPQFESALVSHRVPLDVKEQMLDRAFSGKMRPELLNFLKVVSRHHRMDCLRAILHEVQHQYNELRGRVEVTVQTAEAIDADLLHQIRGTLSGVLQRDVEMQADTQANLIGGMVIRVGDTVYDGSIANRLTRMRRESLARTAGQIRESADRFSGDGE